MKSNFKLAPMSCHCKLSVLIPHLKGLSAKKAGKISTEIESEISAPGEMLIKRYI